MAYTASGFPSGKMPVIVHRASLIVRHQFPRKPGLICCAKGKLTKRIRWCLSTLLSPGRFAAQSALIPAWMNVPGKVLTYQPRLVSWDCIPQQVDLELPSVKSGRKIAVIGGGAAGLTAAWQLARKGHQVTVYEQDERMGWQDGTSYSAQPACA